MVMRSYDRVTTKGKRSDSIPIAAELQPYLEHALRVSPSDLVSPREDGSMHAENTQLEMVLRRALRKAPARTSHATKRRSDRGGGDGRGTFSPRFPRFARVQTRASAVC